MKNSISVLTLSSIAFFITSCTPSFDNDVERAAEITCEAITLAKNSSKEEAQEYTVKHAVEVTEIQVRHVKDANEFRKALLKEMEKCK